MTTPPPGAALPVACALAPAGLAEQAGRWERLIARAMTGRAETADGLRLSFRPGPAVEDELRRLVAVETGCCAWAAWAVESDGEATVLDVRSARPRHQRPAGHVPAGLSRPQAARWRPISRVSAATTRSRAPIWSTLRSKATP